MLLELGTLQVKALVVHEVPARFVTKDENDVPRYSDAATPMDSSLQQFIGDRLKRSLGTRGLEVILQDDNNESPVPGLIGDLLSSKPDPWADEGSLVKASRETAEHLFKTQKGNSPAGLLAVVGGTVDKLPAVAVMKLEKEQGARFELEEIDGKRRFTLEQVKQLVFTDGTKVFKASLFRRADPKSGQIIGVVSDEQLSRTGRREIADFFLERFLGCQLRDEPDITTKEVFYATEDFINSHVTDPVLMSAYQSALLTTMTSNVPQFNPKIFAQEHLQKKDQGQYTRFLRERGLPDHSFKKDLSKIEKQVKQLMFNFEDFKVQASLQAIEDQRVRVSKKGDGVAVLTAEGTLKSVS